MGRSVVDYVICNPSLFEVIRKFKVCEPYILSAYCALEFSLCKTNSMYTSWGEESEESVRLDKKYAWEDAKKGQYNFNLHDADDGFINLYSNLMQAVNSACFLFFRTNGKRMRPAVCKNNQSTGCRSCTTKLFKVIKQSVV